MFDNYKICPYTGLRSFTEDESIYFKGRDEHIQQASALLEKNKYLMLTGASGDGKSSLVFAGIIPYAKSGFLKSKYSNWSVVSFRPERSPMMNLCQSLASELGIKNIETVQSELSHGFSALVDLYKSSKRYLDEESSEYVNSDDKQRGAIKREATNLIILADQFEEFFTNPENYGQGVPSVESSLVVNLLLETAKIALDKDLPIYVVFTMRSDYIGQCAAFRSLPEYIGFSQFFVPRLNRSQLQQVIEEPAVLSGNKISRRLTERLIVDITEDVDQLPILQHALSQIWVKADSGALEMDLLHYAMVGGIAVDELPEEDIQKFNSWFSQLSENIQKCYRNPSLHNVIDTHANKLLAFSADYYFEKTGEKIDPLIAQKVVKSTFQCLTKIDKGRAVRNRMTLKEIHDIIGDASIDVKKLSVLLDQFREPGNTFFRPFISDNEDKYSELKEEDVIDITHESLIRNWQALDEWAKEEFNNISVFQDFYQQVELWAKNKKSSGFLLPIGPLTYFENWFVRLNPNKFWIHRYLKSTSKQSNLDEAEEALNNSQEYLKRSASKHSVTRMVMHYGPRRIAAVIAVLVLILFSSFYVNEMMSRKNEAVLDKMAEDAQELLMDDNARLLIKQEYVIFQERNNPGSFNTILDELTDTVLQTKIAEGVAIDLAINDRFSDIPLKMKSILYADSLCNLMGDNNSIDKKELISVLVSLIDAADYINYHLEKPILNNVIENRSKQLSNLVLDVFRNNRDENWDVKELNEAIELSLNHYSFNKEQIEELIEYISPLEGKQSSLSQSLYPSHSNIRVGARDFRFSFNGLYQVLGYLYGVQGNLDRMLQCVDTLNEYHSNYDEFAVDSYTIGGYLMHFNHWDLLEEYGSLNMRRMGKTEVDFYEVLLDRSPKITGYLSSRFESTNRPPFGIWHNTMLEYQPITTIKKLFELYEHKVKDLENIDERNYRLAMLYKRMATTLAQHSQDKISVNQSEEINELLEKSWLSFGEVGAKYLQEEIGENLYTQFTRNTLFKYPDYLETQRVYEFDIIIDFKSSVFIDWIIDNGFFNTFYTSIDELNQFNYWLSSNINNQASGFAAAPALSMESLKKIAKASSSHPLGESIDKNILYLSLVDALIENGDVTTALKEVQRLKPSGFKAILTTSNWFHNSARFQYICRIYYFLIQNNQNDLASNLMEGIGNNKNRAGLLGYSAVRFAQEGNKENHGIYLDSALNMMEGITSLRPTFWDFRKNIAYAISLEGNEDAKQQAINLTRNLNTYTSFLAKSMILRGVVHNNDYYLAYSDFPPFLSADSKLNYINNILFELTSNSDNSDWKLFDQNYNWLYETVGYTIN